MEVDAYCFSKVAEKALEVKKGALGSGEDAFDALNDALVYFDEHEVPAEKQIIFVSPKFLNLLRSGTKGMSRILQGDVDKDVKFTIDSYEGRKLVMVPPQRFKTDIDLSGNGIKWGSNSEAIDFLVVATDAVMHIVKYNKVKVIGGDMNLAGANFDGYSIFARIYHDVFVPDNKRYALYLHTTNSGSGISTVYAYALNATVVEGKIREIGLNDPSIKAKFVKSSTSKNVGETLSDGTAVKVGSSVTVSDSTASPAVTGDILYALDTNNVVLAKKAL